MNLVAISTCGVLGTYVIGQVTKTWPVSRVLRPDFGVPRPDAEPRWAKLKTAPLRSLVQSGRRRLQTRRIARMESAACRQLFGSDQLPPLENVEEIPVWAINQQRTADLLESLEPDYLLLAGAPIIRQKLLSIPKVATLNVHMGIAPHYRGENTLFWPLYFADYQQIGVTLHYVDQHVDTGRVVAQGFPALVPTDSEASLFAKCTEMAAGLLIEFFNAAEQAPVEGIAQKPSGRQFFARDRTIWRDMHYQMQRNIFRKRPQHQPRRVVRHFASQDRVDAPHKAGETGLHVDAAGIVRNRLW